MIKSLKWKSSTPGNNTSSLEREEEYDHPNMTVEFPSPLNTEGGDDLTNNNVDVVGGHNGHNHSAADGEEDVDKALLFHHQDTTASPSPSSSATSDDHHNNNDERMSSTTNGSSTNQQQQQQKQEQGYTQFLTYLESDTQQQQQNDTSYRSANSSAVNTSIDIINEEEEETVRSGGPKFIQTKTELRTESSGTNGSSTIGGIASTQYGGRPSMRDSYNSTDDEIDTAAVIFPSSPTTTTSSATGGGKKSKIGILGRRCSHGSHEGDKGGGGGGGGAIREGEEGEEEEGEEEEERDDEYDVKAAFEKEHKAVRKFKVVVVVVLVAAAVAVSAVVYRFTSNGERQNLSTEYDDYAAKFITNFHHLAVMRQWAAYSAAALFTAKSIDNYGPGEKPWPNATLPDFHDQVRGLLVLAHSTGIEFSPFFPNNDTVRSEWEAYAVENEELIRYVPEWAKGGHGGGHDTGGGHDMEGDGGGHDAAMDHGAEDPHTGHNMEENSSSSHSMVMDSEHDMGPDMNEALAIANATGQRLLRGRKLQHSHNEAAVHDMGTGGHQSEATQSGEMDHELMSHLEAEHEGGKSPPDHDHDAHMEKIATTLKYDDGGCIGISEVSKDMLPAEWGGTGNAAYTHPSRPVDEGIYTMNRLKLVDETHNVSEMPFLAPTWQMHPSAGHEGKIMYNEYSDCNRRRAINTMIKTGGPAMSEVLVGFEDFHHYFDEPSGILTYPVHNKFEEGNKVMVGFITITFAWKGTFWNILPDNVKGVYAVLETSTGQKSTFRVNGKFGEFIGEGDHHDTKWDHMKRSSSIYRVYAIENDVKEMVGHHRNLMRYLEEVGSGHNTGGADDEMLIDGEHIDYRIHIYPSNDFEACYLTSQPKIFSLAVSLVFLVTVISFIVYDILVEKRQKKLLANAERSGKVVASLFPAMVRERLFYERQSRDEEKMNVRRSSVRGMGSSADISRLRKFMAPTTHLSQSQGGDSDTATAVSGSSPPIADLYNDTTVMFADIAGFTAWSSEREPTQVFQLLESLFCEFDAEAKSMKVFKIETIGDCYVAVTGLPEPTPDHAVIMAKFAQRCLLRFSELTKELELSLGPGTADLGIRVGLHSGPVTAGVLRGEKARFQLFGDTMNTASRMESTSIKNMIQISADTAFLLKKSGKGHTLIAREGLIKAKGKGYMQTYWLRPKSAEQSSTSSNLSERFDVLQASQHEVEHIHSRAQHDVARAELGLPSFSHQKSKLESNQLNLSSDLLTWNETGFSDTSKNKEGLHRLIKWNTAVLESILTKVVVHRHGQQRRSSFKKLTKHDIEYDDSVLFHEEIATAVNMPSFDRESMSASCLMPSNEKVNLIPPKAREELRGYVARIASMYQDVHFHSFEHASHVTMSAQKLINKVVLRNSAELSSLSSKRGDKKGEKELQTKSEEKDLFFSTYGISSDPLAQFAVVFAALVHDVEHRGIPNVQLIKEHPDLGMKYKNKSVAENNSIRVAWGELFKPEFANLRRCIFGSDDDESRFRQLLINVVIATDITDKERRAVERERWQAAFLGNGNDFDWEKEWQDKSEEKLSDIDVSLKATVVLEQIVLASDVAHTMQHWLTYVKWNERLYKEMWAAYASGRAETDPTEGWYLGEIGFFDGYIIPLATKLKECGVFGTAGDEYLGNALRNKAEWQEKGRAIVAEFEAKIKRKSDIDTSEAGTSDKSTSSSSLMQSTRSNQ